ncbi:hypothetical protein DAI22_08g073000 [Oryza sativa Japonica Group]|nr:hypothetical protein DAI22_08g073000 [Oryza sativa Japonica Group]
MGSKKRMSRYAKKHEEATLKFDVVGYSLNEGMAAGEFIRSPAFAVGATTGQSASTPTAPRESVSSLSEPRMFSSTRCPKPQRSNPMQRYRLEKEESGYIKDDCLKIECVLTVVHKPIVSNAKGRSEIEVPPSDLSDHLGKLLEEEETADVDFIVGGSKIAAHKSEREARSVTVDDTQPDVFRALPHFMYTDSLPDMDGVEDADYVEMIRLLLVAADRYAMDRMKLLCESVLDDLLDAETVGTTLALADQHSCNNLKDVCVKFMATSKGMDAVMATEGYDNLKRNCPYVLIDVLEKVTEIQIN